MPSGKPQDLSEENHASNEIVYHRDYATARPQPSLGATKLLRSRRAFPNSIGTRSDPPRSVRRFRDEIPTNSASTTGPQYSPFVITWTVDRKKKKKKKLTTPLESFLPFDLENLFSSFFILSVISAILPDTQPDPDFNYREMGFSLLDDMISRGNRVAQLRKSEVELLEELIQPLVQASTPPVGYENDATSQTPGINAVPTVDSVLPASALSSVDVNQDEDLGFDWRDYGLSLEYMFSVTDQLNANNLVLDAEREGLQNDLWLWSDG